MKTSEANTPFYALLARMAFSQHRQAMWLLDLARRYPENAAARRMDAEAVRAAAWASIAEAKVAKARAQERRAA